MNGMKSPTPVINGQKATKSLIKSMINGLNSKKIRTEKGGYLFKAAQDHKTFYLGIVPEFNQGERNYHYQIDLAGGGGGYFLTGSLNPEGIFSLLFIPESPDLSPSDIINYRNLYLGFAENLLAWGLDRPGPLDQVTRLLLDSSGLFKEQGVPKSLSDLCRFSE